MSGLSGEDRARLDAHTTGAYRPDCPPYYCELCDDCEAALTRALALIDQQEKALEWQGSVTKALLEAQARYVKTIDQQEEALRAADAWVDAVLQHRGETAAFDAYVAARATSTKEDG